MLHPMRHNMSSLTTTHEMNDQSKTEIRQVSQFLVHPHPPDRFHIHYFFYKAFRSDPMRNTQSQFLLVLPLKSPRADKNPGFPLLAVPHMWNPACAGNTGHKQGEQHPRGGRNDADTDFIHALHEESDPLYGANALLPAISIHALHEESEVQLDIFVRFLRRKPAA